MGARDMQLMLKDDTGYVKGSGLKQTGMAKGHAISIQIEL